MPCSLIVPPETQAKLARHASDLRSGSARPGARLEARLDGAQLGKLTDEQLLPVLLDTKAPCIFAESEVRGDGRDWTLQELALLGDLSVAGPFQGLLGAQLEIVLESLLRGGNRSGANQARLGRFRFIPPRAAL